FLRWERTLCAGLALLVVAVPRSTAADAPGRLQMLIDQAAPEAEVVVPAGTWKEPVVINKPLKLRGASAEKSVIEVTADQAAVRIQSRVMVVLESLTIRW